MQLSKHRIARKISKQAKSKRKQAHQLLEALEGRRMFSGTRAFNPPVDAPVAEQPYMSATGDFNRDGKLDAAVADFGTSQISILLGLGNGSFQPTQNLTAGGNQPTSVAVGDFTGDGLLDIVSTNRFSSNISLYAGNGNGGFGAPSNFSAGGYSPVYAVGADFNADGRTDLAVADSVAANLTILLSTGGGNFSAPAPYAMGVSPSSLTLADFNGDGRVDIASSVSYNASVLLSNGNGTFAPATNYLAGQGTGWIASGDFNGDGRADLAVSSISGQNVSILLNNGSGTFGAVSATYSAPSVMSIAAGDIDKDGRADVVMTNSAGNSMGVLWSNGNGTFTAGAQAFSAGVSPRGVTLGDFNGDGFSDALVTNLMGNNVSTLLYAATAPQPDTAAPTTATNASNFAGVIGTTTPYQFNVTYLDNTAVNVSSINSSDVRVTGPNGFSQLATLVSVDSPTNGTPRTATYRVNAPAGGWSASNSGSYTLALQAGEVVDTSGNAAAAGTLATITATISPPDNSAPFVSVFNAPTMTSASDTYSIQVTYSDNVAVQVSTLNNNDIRVFGPNDFAAFATFVSVDVNSDGTPRTATYRIPAPGGGAWTSAANGNYQVNLYGLQVSDTSGNFAAGAVLGNFTINVGGAVTPPPPPPVNVAPVVSMGTSAVTVGTGIALSGGGSFSDADSSAWSATVDYGDGSGTQALPLGADKSFVLNKTYSLAGVYNVKVTVSDGVAASSATTAVTVISPTGWSATPGTNYTITTGAGGAKTLTLNSGVLTLAADAAAAYANLTLNVNGSNALVNMNVSQHLAALNISAGGVVTPEGSQVVLVTKGLSINSSNGAYLDLADNAVIWDYSAAGLASTGGASPLATARGYLISGRGGGGFTPSGIGSGGGTGIVSRTVAGGDGISTAIGYAENGDLPLGSFSSFCGQSVDATAVLIKYTRSADANLDGKVDSLDVTLVGADYGASGTGQWYLGDFDYDGMCDTDDVTVIGTTYNPVAPILAPFTAPANSMSALSLGSSDDLLS